MFKRGLCAVAVFTAMLLPQLAVGQVTVEDRLGPGQPPVIVAHRASGGDFPENSLASIQYAIDRGVDMIEVDVQITFDDQHILLHDGTLERTTNVKAVFPDGSPHRKHIWNLALDYTLEEIKQLQLTDGTDRGEHRVPSLDEVLELINGRILVILEIKTYDLERLASTFQTYGMENILIFSKDPWKLHDAVVATGASAFAEMDSSGNYLSGLQKLLDTVGPRLAMVRVKRERLTPEFVAKANEAGVHLCINGMGFEDTALAGGDPTIWQETLSLGAAAYMTDQPDQVLGLLDR